MLARPLCAALALMLLTVPALARSGAYKYAADYSDVRGFNYNTASSLNTDDEWENYHHAEVDRDFGYANRLQLNAVRVFLSYKAWVADKTRFRANLRDFVRTAFAHRSISPRISRSSCETPECNLVSSIASRSHRQPVKITSILLASRHAISALRPT